MNTTIFSQGDIVLVPWPYTDYSNEKYRPALVISNRNFNDSSLDVILIAFSSNIMNKSQYDVEVSHPDAGFAQTGLKVSSVLKCGKIFSMEKRCITRKLGNLSIPLLSQAKKKLAEICTN